MDRRNAGTGSDYVPRSAPRMNIGDANHGPIYGGVIGGHRNSNAVYNFWNAVDSGLELLERHVVTDAFYDSRQREQEHSSTCHPDTHTRILGKLKNWTQSTESSVCWLRGPAGTGKSTIAQTIAEQCDQEGKLAATFFFSRGKGDREDINKLVPTLAYQIVKNIPQSQVQMGNLLKEDRTILSLQLEKQFSKLIVEPLTVNSIQQSDPRLIVIDGLDECSEKTGVVTLLRLLGETMANWRRPLLFLLTSRPETYIFHAFQSYLPNKKAYQLSLEDSVDDIRKYFKEHLRDIRQKYSLIMKDQLNDWPSTEDLEELVTKSQGLFIYASTLVQYLDDGMEPPQDKLRKGLKVHAGVDPLYTQVLTEALQHPNFHWVIGSLMYHRRPVPMAKLPQLLRLDIPNIRMALDRCHSVLAIPEDDNEAVQTHHASLRDFITTLERSGVRLFCGPAEFHAKISIECLKVITEFRGDGSPDEYACIEWHYHISLLLSQANCSQEDFRSLCREVKNINFGWLQYWMMEALCWAGVEYFRVALPSAAGMCTEAKTLHVTLERIMKVLEDFLHYDDDRDYRDRRFRVGRVGGRGADARNVCFC